MNDLSYLLVLDGSASSRASAALAWKLAGATSARVVAQHVIDIAGVWRFLSFDATGFVGSGVYMEARERIIAVLHSIAEALVLSYESLSEGCGIKAETCIDEGDTVMEIARRSRDHDLVICGGLQDAGEQLLFLQKLVMSCSCPILIVRDSQKPWSKLQVLSTRAMANSSRDSNLYMIGTSIGLPVEVQTDEDLPRAGSMIPENLYNSFDIRNLRRSTLKEMLRSACDDVLLIVPISALAEGKLNRGLKIVKIAFARLARPVKDIERSDLSENQSRIAL